MRFSSTLIPCAAFGLSAAFLPAVVAAQSRICPTPSQFAQISQCCNLIPSGDVKQVERCARPWSPSEIWQCLKTDPQLGRLTLQDLYALQHTPPPAPVPPPPANAVQTCIDYMRAMVTAVNQANPGASDFVKGLALQRAMAMVGCASPPSR